MKDRTNHFRVFSYNKEREICIEFAKYNKYGYRAIMAKKYHVSHTTINNIFKNHRKDFAKRCLSLIKDDLINLDYNAYDSICDDILNTKMDIDEISKKHKVTPNLIMNITAELYKSFSMTEKKRYIY